MKRILFSAILALTFTFSAIAAPAEVCPHTGGWEKSGENAVHVTITLTGDQVSWVPDSGWTIIGICWKSGQEVQIEYGLWTAEVIRFSASGQDVSHAAALMEQVPLETPTSIVPTPTATPTDAPTIEPTSTVDPTSTPIDEPTATGEPPDPTPTTTDEPTETPTDEPTPTSTDEPTPTETDEPPQPTPTDDPTPTETPTDEPTPEPTDPPEPTPTSTPSLFIPSAGFVEGSEASTLREITESTRPELSIPSIDFLEIVTTAPRDGDSWKLNYEPSILEGVAAIGIHSGYSATGWNRLNELQAGASLIWANDIYVVRDVFTVDPTRIDALRFGDLAIFTCISFDGSEWQERLVIISERIIIL